MPFTQLNKNLKAIDLTKMLTTILNQNHVRDMIIEFNQDRLEDKGTDYDNTKLKTYSSLGSNVYTLYTIAQKKKKGQPINRVTLKDSGEFYKSFRVKTVKAITIIIANFNKGNEDISDNLDTSKVLGLTDKDIDDLIEFVLTPQLTDFFYEQAFKNL